MMAATTVVGIDVSRDWLDGFGFPGGQRCGLANPAEGHDQLIAMIRNMPGPVKVGFEGAEDQGSIPRRAAVMNGCSGLPLSQQGSRLCNFPRHRASHLFAMRSRPMANAFALSRGARAKTDRIDAELVARLMHFRPEAGRRLPRENLRILRALATRRAQIVDMRKRLAAQITARKKQSVPADVESMDEDLKAMPETRIGTLECRIENVVAQDETSAAQAKLLRSIPGIGPVSAAMLIAEMPELGRRTAGEVAAMTGLAPVPHDSGTMRGRRTIAGGRRAPRHAPYQAALAAACHNPVPKPIAQRPKTRGKPRKLVILAITRGLVTIANAILKTTLPWHPQPGT